MTRKRRYFGRTAHHKKRVMLDREHKIEVAKQIVAGAHVKQVAAKFNISLDACYKIIQEFTVVARYLRIPPEKDEQDA